MAPSSKSILGAVVLAGLLALPRESAADACTEIADIGRSLSADFVAIVEAEEAAQRCKLAREFLDQEADFDRIILVLYGRSWPRLAEPDRRELRAATREKLAGDIASNLAREKEFLERASYLGCREKRTSAGTLLLKAETQLSRRSPKRNRSVVWTLFGQPPRVVGATSDGYNVLLLRRAEIQSRLRRSGPRGLLKKLRELSCEERLSRDW